MSCAPRSDIHKDTIHKLCVLLECCVYQTVLGLPQRNGIGRTCLKVLTTLSKVLGQLMHLNLVAQQIVEKQIGGTLILLVAKYDITLSTFGYSALEELLLMAQEHILLIGSSLQRTDTGYKVVAYIFRKTMNTKFRLYLNTL